MLKDYIKIKIESGRGGFGSMSMMGRRSTGGDGGRGGKVYFQGSENIYDLRNFNEDKIYKAEDGKRGGIKNQTGSIGKDLVIYVPLVTEIVEEGKLLCTISKHGQKELILKGGMGTYGNVTLRRKPKLRYEVVDSDPQKKTVELILKLQSDIIFLGFPNAGKSSILNSLTEAKAKTAPYAFTTLDPQIGLMDGIKLMDLPGLIEGTHEGKGLGTKFLKHTENTKLVAHFISLENSDILKTYKSLRNEIKNISKELFEKKEIIILTKIDEVEEKVIKKAEKLFKSKGMEVVSCSIIDDESIRRLREKLREVIEK